MGLFQRGAAGSRIESRTDQCVVENQASVPRRTAVWIKAMLQGEECYFHPAGI
jgi:hypothetical protein